MYTDFNHFSLPKQEIMMHKSKVTLRLPPDLYFVTALPLPSKTHYW